MTLPPADILQRLVGSALIGGAFVMAAFAFNKWRQLRSANGKDGWRYLVHGPIYWVAMLGCLGMTALFWWIYLFVPSARSDAASETTALMILTFAFGLATILFAYALAVEELRWNDLHVECRTLLLQRRRMTWHQLASCGYDPVLGSWWINAFDGPKIRFSPYCHGVGELLAKIREHLPSDLPPGAIEIIRKSVAVRA